MIWFVAVPLLIVWAIGVIDIVRRPLSGSAKAGWIALVLLLPFVGTIVYFALRKPSKEEGMLRAQAEADLPGGRTGGDAGPPPPPID